MNKDVSREEKANRERQRESNKAADWIKVFFADGTSRMMRRADYERRKR